MYRLSQKSFLLRKSILLDVNLANLVIDYPQLNFFWGLHRFAIIPIDSLTLLLALSVFGYFPRFLHFQLMDVEKSRLAIRKRTIGMLLAGSTQKTVANTLV